MAIHHGNEGVVTVGGNVVANIRSFSLEETIDMVDASAMGGTSRLYKTGLQDWSAQIECFWDETDTNGQEAMTIGATVAVLFLPEGNTSGDVSATVSAIIENVGVSVSADDIVSRTFSLKPANNSGVTWGTVA